MLNRFFCIPIILSCAMTALAQPIQLHPDNGHYFLWKGEPTVLITSAEHYGAVLNLDFDYEPYLEELQAHGLNQTRTFSGTYREIPGSFNIEKNTLAPKEMRYIGPWSRSEEPGYKGGGNKFDLTKWDDAYFARLKDFLRKAGERGVIVEYVLFCPFYNEDLWLHNPMHIDNNINGIGDIPATEVYTLKHPKMLDVHEAFVRKAVKEINEFDNLYIEICNEPYFKGVTEEWQNRIAEIIVETERDLPKKHLIAKNIANGSGVIEHPNPHVSVYNYHYAYPPDAVKQNYHLNKVIGYDETGFAGSSDDKYRGDAWAFLLAGGAVYSNLDYSFTIDQEDGTAEYKAPGGGSRTLRQQLNILRQFMNSLDFIHMKPDNGVIQSIEPKKVRAWALVKESEQYGVYFREGEQVNVSLKLPEGSYQAQWVDTKTGDIAKSEEIDASDGFIKLESPKYKHDVALKVLRK